jgi:hypothetical protein
VGFPGSEPLWRCAVRGAQSHGHCCFDSRGLNCVFGAWLGPIEGNQTPMSWLWLGKRRRRAALYGPILTSTAPNSHHCSGYVTCIRTSRVPTEGPYPMMSPARRERRVWQKRTYMVCIEPGDLIQAGCTSLVQRLKGSWRLNGLLVIVWAREGVAGSGDRMWSDHWWRIRGGPEGALALGSMQEEAVASCWSCSAWPVTLCLIFLQLRGLPWDLRVLLWLSFSSSIYSELIHLIQILSESILWCFCHWETASEIEHILKPRPESISQLVSQRQRQSLRGQATGKRKETIWPLTRRETINLFRRLDY